MINDTEFYINGLLVNNITDTTIFDIKNKKLKITRQPNSSDRFCFILDSVMKQKIKEIIENYYGDIREYIDDKFIRFNKIIGFITINSENNTNGVCMHRDNSDYTFNMFLNDDYEGGSIIFNGKSDKFNEKYYKITKKIDNNFICTILPEKYKMILHRGYNAHQVERVKNGIRYNLILWCYETDNKFNDTMIENINDFII
jgi:hypothetical protein